MHKYLLILITIFFTISHSASAQKTKHSDKNSNSNSQGHRKHRKDEGSENEGRKRGKHGKNKTQDTQSMLASYGSRKTSATSYLSRPIYYKGRTYTGVIENLNGYRICVYTGSNRDEAMKTKALFNTYYKGVASYMSYVLPNYKIKVGNYEDKKVAQKALKDFQARFPAAFVSPDIVRVVRRSLYVKPAPPTLEDMNNGTNNSDNTTTPNTHKKKKKKKIEEEQNL